MATVTGAQLITEVETLAKQAGEKYFYGGTSTTTGFDCSGIIYAALLKLGYTNPPRTSEDQWAFVQKVSKSQLAPGDLVFAQFPGDNASPGHVGIYIGGGNVFSAQDPQLGIGVSSLSSWAGNIVGYGKIPGSTESSGSTDDSAGGLLGIPSQITQGFSDFSTFISAVMWLTEPGSWLRIGAFVVGSAFLIAGIIMLAKSSGLDIHLPPIPVPVPAPV